MLSPTSREILDNLQATRPYLDFGQVIDVKEFDPSATSIGSSKRIILVSCYSPRRRIVSEEYRDFLLIIQNSYLLSFVSDIASLAIYHQSHRTPELPAERLRGGFSAIAKKFAAEHMESIASSKVSRTMFLEAVQHIESNTRYVHDVVGSESNLNEKLTVFLRYAISFIRFHEVGHLSDVDHVFRNMILPDVNQFIDAIADHEFDKYDETTLRRELLSDVFSLNTCFAKFCSILSEETLKNFSECMIDILTALNALYAASEDAYRLNVDEAFQGSEIAAEFRHWRYRREYLQNYITGFVFDDGTLRCRAEDDIGVLTEHPEIFQTLFNINKIVDPLTDHENRLAQIFEKYLNS